MIDKQINLYRNINEASEQRRKVRAVGIFVLVAAAVLGWAASEQARSHRVVLEAKVAAVERDIQTERSLIEALGAELKKRQGSNDRISQTTFAQDLARLGDRQGNELLGVSRALASWAAPGAALRRASYENGVLTVAGEARDTRSARKALEAWSAALGGAKSSWAILSQEVRESAEAGGVMEFKSTFRLMEVIR